MLQGWLDPRSEDPVILIVRLFIHFNKMLESGTRRAFNTFMIVLDFYWLAYYILLTCHRAIPRPPKTLTFIYIA